MNNINAFLIYPVYLVIFYYKDVLIGTLRVFIEFNRYLISLLSMSLLLRTFFKPLKNEYREGLVGFSRVFGVFIKSVLLFTTSLIFILVLLFEISFLLFMLFLPISFLLII